MMKTLALAKFQGTNAYGSSLQGSRISKESQRDARKRIYRGRFACPDVQWTGSSNDLLATFTITADELTGAAESGLLWTDQDVQRGIQPGIEPPPPRELSLADGYPDTTKYVFDAENADDIAEKLMNGEKLFLSPLVWNLRPGTFEAYWDEQERYLYLYQGRFYLPDSHHRQQAIVKAVRLWRTAPKDYPRFSGSKQFKIDLYFLKLRRRGELFLRQEPTTETHSQIQGV